MFGWFGRYMLGGLLWRPFVLRCGGGLFLGGGRVSKGEDGLLRRLAKIEGG